jgi:hypothetical protein
MKTTSPTILTPQQWSTYDRMRKWGGRKKGTTGGSLVSDLVALKKAILLCGTCQGKFDWRHHGYYSVWRYEHQPVTGPCDVCSTEITGNDGRLFLYDAERHQCWVSADEKKAHAASVRRRLRK